MASEDNSKKRCSSPLSYSTPSTHKYLQKRGKIVLLGDSITQMSTSAKLSGWGSYIADIYQRRCDVYNRGMSGYNTDWFLKFVETDIGYHDVFGMMNEINPETEERSETSSVMLVTIFFGANDASSKELNPRHHVPIPKYESNLKTILQKCYQNYGTKTRIVLITPPPVCHQSRLEYQIVRYKDKATGNLERTLTLSGEYARAVVKVGKEMDVPVLNIWEMMQSQELKTKEGDGGVDNEEGSNGKHPWSIYLSDGLHLSQEGNLFVGEKLAELISQEYPDVAVTPCPYTDHTGTSSSKGGIGLGSECGGGIGPWHDEIDYLDADRAFESMNFGPTTSTKKIRTEL